MAREEGLGSGKSSPGMGPKVGGVLQPRQEQSGGGKCELNVNKCELNVN
jgi:hypothetical protein